MEDKTALRGHNDSGPLVLELSKEKAGNLSSILRYALNHNKELLEIRDKADKMHITQVQ